MFNKIYEKIKQFIKDNYKFIISIILIIFLFYYELPYMIYKSGGTINLDNRIEIDKEYEEKGSLSMSYVTAMKGTPAFVLLSYIMPDWDLEKISSIEKSYDDVLEIGKEYLNEGIDNAIIAAFNESDYSVTIKKEISRVIYISSMAKTNIKIGDEILKINDKEVNSFEEIRSYLNSLEENEEVSVFVKNGSDYYTRNASLYKDEDGKLKIGVAFSSAYEYETEIPIKVKMKNNESGSSGGLMMSLAIYNALTEEDITHGLKIVGTGSITKDGKVEEIGGVKYKVLAAQNAKADIFFCPEENYDEAIKTKEKRKLKIDIIKVSTLKDAINYLDNLEN